MTDASWQRLSAGDIRSRLGPVLESIAAGDDAEGTSNAAVVRHVVAVLATERDELTEMLTKLRQDVWDALGILGDDLDGDPTPAAVVSDLGEWLKDHARGVQEELEEAGNEVVEAEEMLTAATDTAVQRGKHIDELTDEAAYWRSLAFRAVTDGG